MSFFYTKHKNITLKLKIIYLALFAGFFLFSAIYANDAVSSDYSNVKIAPPSRGGIYIGQYQWMKGDIETFEKAIKRKIAWGSKKVVVEFSQAGHPIFDNQAAEQEWQQGRIVIAEAYEAIPDPNEVRLKGFTVDQLLLGKYDIYLKRLAKQFKQFNKPMIFNTAREPNGIGAKYFGGFGKNGDKSLLWALKNKKGFAEFDPSKYPRSSILYPDLGDPNVSDGVERLKAAQRYYYDFFVRREGIKFLTFDTMGWVVNGSGKVNTELSELPSDIDKTHAKKLLESSYEFKNFYPGDEYVDWVSINLYTLDFYAKDWKEFSKDYRVDTKVYLHALDHTMAKIDKVAKSKPIFFLELGFPDGKRKNSKRAASRISAVFSEILSKHPRIQGFFMWSFHPYWESYFPYDALIRPDTKQASAFQKVMKNINRKFLSCVVFTDGRKMPTCKPK